MNNPLLCFDDLAAFDCISAEHVTPAIDTLLAQANAALKRVSSADLPADWQTIASVLDVAVERLSRSWGVVSHLSSVADSPELRAAFNAALPKVTDFYTRLGADQQLFEKYQAIDAASLNDEQQQALRNTLRNFVLGGAKLQGSARQRFAAIQEQLAAASQKFSENTLDATDSFAYYASLAELDGVPADVIQACQNAAQADGQPGYKLSLKPPCYIPVMQFAHNSQLRQTLYRAYVTRASDQATADGQKFDNTKLITQLLQLRQEEAQLLGYANFAELSLVPKMANSSQQVLDFLRDLGQRARPFAEQDLAELRQFAATQLKLPEPQAWDWLYVSEQLKQARYAFNEQEVKQYFPLPKVLSGLFYLVQTLFEVQIRQEPAATWHPDVSFYRIERANQDGTSRLVGQFYLDPTARNGKRGGAWMNDARERWLRPDSHQLQTPVAYLVCNFAAGVGSQPALLTHDDVITLFHEFGHGLHHLLTQVNERDVSGINGVEWDAVELPSQLMENFCWQRAVIKHISAHVDTGLALPDALFDKMLAAKNFQSGLQTLRQIELALFDMLLHSALEPASDIMALLQQVRQEVAVLQPPDYNRSAHTFSHIFAGGYAAGYYSYKWAEVLSADAYAAFEESINASGWPSIEVSRLYRQEILEAGGARCAMLSFKAFRGREPTIDALLRQQGMIPR